MQSQRGSVTVIAVVMLLFLMIIAIAWLPMMTTEKTAAASDYREQQAWYAAEAGYKRAVAELEAGKSNVLDWLSSGDDLEKGTFDEKNILEIQETQTKAVESSAIWYAVAIDGISKDKTYSPEAGKTYAITSVGSCQGIRKVIRKDFILGDDGESEGEEEPPQEDVYLIDALVASGGAVSIYFVNGDNSGKVYGSSIDAPGFKKVGVVPDNSVKYYVQDKVFSSSYYKDIQNNIEQDLTDGSLLIKGNYYYRNADINNNISVAGSSVLLTSRKISLSNSTIEIPENCNLQVVANGNIDIANVKVTGMGQLTIISKGLITINSLTGDSRILIIGSKVKFDNPDVRKCFISSNSEIDMKITSAIKKLEYCGQMQATGSIAISGINGKPNLFKVHFVKIGEELTFPPMN
ncbi:hypothetical protein CE91St52_01140 [Phascolarctobacterium faecium]|uniref:pilus assembly PilX family protein n=1 Tax=Phascolarctobacterium faecium TaxID=33025 RepID=UPI001FCC2D9C|nr:pilus assembly PilX N-terminal domain-containing protein [Phascolarctobacterium faecium]BDE83337.1 hypothetical protein CE91St52_01140 [Phascolarctobacterium faecium]BDE92461.1 hypothetical protein CE91St53_01130 [Phascolarctobacterium faecium]